MSAEMVALGVGLFLTVCVVLSLIVQGALNGAVERDYYRKHGKWRGLP